MIEFHNITKTYQKNWTALDNINFNVQKGSFTFIVGPSGSGKSTLLKLIYAALTPDLGFVRIGEFRNPGITTDKIPLLRRKVGVIFQDFRLMQDRTVYENISFVLLVTGTPRRIIKDKVAQVLAELSLTHKLHHYPFQLSGGEQQKIAIARALVRNPFVLVADEPTGNIDPQGSEEIFKLLQKINAGGTTVIMATHDSSFLQKASAYRMIALDHGKVVKDVPPPPSKG